MSGNLFKDLGWLPAVPSNFATLCRDFPLHADDAGARMRYLATHVLDENDIHRLANTLRRARSAGVSLAPLQPFRLGIISNATSHYLVEALEIGAIRHGFLIQVIQADFGQVMQEAVSPNSIINQSQVDAVLIALDYRGLPMQAVPGDKEAANGMVDAALSQVAAVRAGLRQHGNPVCIVQTLARPVESLFGSFDAAASGCLRTMIDAFNAGLAASLADSPDLLFDVAQLADTVGLAEWFNPKLWHMAKIPFANQFVPLYAEHLCRIIAAMRGKSRRCLILDLDNTLWGGVIGDDGLEGIVIGQGNATGEAYLEVQRAARALRARGVVLAVSSKNTDDVARKPFREHPDMLLREEHIAVFQANWSDKATNISSIASELSLGLDSMVFLDDNPVERALIRQTLPQVAVPELPDDPSLFARTLLAAGYFESINFSSEDRHRADFYQENARRATLKDQTCDLNAYLLSLEMQMQIQPFDQTGRARITQLIAKSNQFNLTTRRYSESEVAKIEQDAECLAVQVRLRDCFGDNGMICVVICRQQGTDWEIDTWLMSCRVLGRKVERAVLQVLCEQAVIRGIHRLIGVYHPTERNDLVKDHYANLGFALIRTRENGATEWALNAASLREEALPMTILQIGLESIPSTYAPKERATA